MMLGSRSSPRATPLLLAVALAFLAGVGLIFSRLPAVAAAESTTGARVILMRECTASEERNRGDSRDIYVTLRNDGSVVINEKAVAEKDLASQISDIFSHRMDRVLSLVGEDGVTYQRVAGTAAELQGQVDGLHIFLPTESNLTTDRFFCLVPNGISSASLENW